MRVAFALLLVVVLVAPAAAGEQVRVYTNTDLEKYGPPSEPVEKAEQDDELGWQFVTDFIEREHARLEQQRRRELDRQLVEAEVDELDRRSRRTSIALPYYYNYYYPGRVGRGRRVGTESPRSKTHFSMRHAPSIRRSAAADLFRPIVPLHARRPLNRPRPVGHGHGRRH
jgi:hypothetical protein